MWRGFGADSEPEPPAQRSYFRPRISSISGVLAMTKQRLFTSGPIKDEVAIENVAHTSAIHPVTSGPSVVAVVGGGGHHLGHISGSISGPSSTHGNLLLTDQYMLNNGLGPIGRCPSPARSSYGDVMSFSRSASARPSIDSQTAHAIYDLDNYGYNYYLGDPLNIHDPSEAELGGVGPESDGRFAKRSRKLMRGFFLMVIIALSWVTTVHTVKMSFHTDRVLLTVSPGNYSASSSSGSHQAIPPLGAIPGGRQTGGRNVRQLPQQAAHNETAPNNIVSPPQSVPQLAALPPGSGPSTRRPTSTISLHRSSSSGKATLKANTSNEYPKSRFDAPYFVTWYITVWNLFYLPIYLMIHFCCLSRQAKSSSSAAESNSASVGSSAVSNNGAFGSNTTTNKVGSAKADSSTTDEGSTTSMKKVFIESIQGLMDKGFTWVQFMWRIAFFSTLALLSNYMLYFTLRILSATVVLCIFATTVSINYLLSWVVLHQQFVGIRIVAIIITDTGIAVLAYMDGVQHRTLAAVMITFGGGIVYAVYKVLMRRMIGYTTFAQMALFHTLVGVFTLLFTWPLVFLLYWTSIETIIWSEIPWGFITLGAFSAFMANVVASFGVICTYESFLTLGMFFAVLISALIDIYINLMIFKDMKLGGVILCLTGFMVVLLPDNWNSYMTNIFRKRIANWKKREALKKSMVRGPADTSTGQLSRLRTSSGRVK